MMKTTNFFPLLLCLLASSLFSQSNINQSLSVNSTGAAADASAQLDVSATDKGMLVPRMTSLERAAIASPATGLLVFDTTTGGFWFYNGTAWQNLSAPKTLQDADGDTKIQVEESPDEDIIRFDLGGTENMVLRKNASGIARLELLSSQSNTFMGVNAGSANTTGSFNTALGWFAQYSATTGSYNTALGTSSLNSNSTGNGNTALGTESLISNSTGNLNTAIGNEALSFNTSGSLNTALGNKALFSNTSGSNNIAIGYDADVTSGNLTNATAIGYNAKVGCNNCLVLGGTGTDAVNVGIGTSTPNAMLHLQDGALLAQGTTGVTPASGAGTRMMWIPAKSAFRAGWAQSSQWDNANIGNYSIALGRSPTASGEFSFSAGYNTRSEGQSSISLGHDAWASNDRAVAIGYITIASGNKSVAIGDGAEASGESAAAIGYNPNATGVKSVAIGEFSTASGSNSIVIGNNCTSSGNQSFSAGYYSQAKSYGETSVGLFNTDYTPISTTSFIAEDRLFVIGNGVDAANRSNAVTVLKNGNVGIGKNNPSSPLDVNGATRTLGLTTTSLAAHDNGVGNRTVTMYGGNGDQWFNFRRGGAPTGHAGLIFSDHNGEHHFLYNSGDYLDFKYSTEASEDPDVAHASVVTRVRIKNSDGIVGIGRTPVTNRLEVEGEASKSSAGDWLANSDACLKKNITPLNSEEMLQKLLALQGITYEWNDDKTGSSRPEGIQYGFTAQNIQMVFPTLVEEDKLGYLQTAYGTYDAMTVEAIRALNEKIEAQQAEIDRLKKVETQLDKITAALQGAGIAVEK